MPELFCGFSHRSGEGPTLYPVACAPQAWAAAAVFLLLQACLGLHSDGIQRRVSVHYPILPNCLEQLQIRHLRVGATSVDLHLQQHPTDVGLTVLRREGDVEIVVVK